MSRPFDPRKQTSLDWVDQDKIGEPARPARGIASSELEAELALRRCAFDVAWVGRCKKRTEHSDTVMCEEHAVKRCWCGAQAVRQCSITVGPLVCGMGLCAAHQCAEPSSMLDDGVHSKEGFEQWKAWSAA